MIRRAAALAIVLLGGACDATDDDQVGGTAAPETTLPAAVTAVTAALPAAEPSAGTEPTMNEPPDDNCLAVEQRFVETAAQAFLADQDRWPVDTVELVDLGYLREPSTAFEVLPDGTVERIGDAPCSDWDFGDDEVVAWPPTVDEMLEQMGDAMIAELGGIGCATERAVAIRAYQEYLDANGGPVPEQFSDIEPFLDRPLTLWIWDVPNDRLEPAPDSGCSNGPLETSDDDPCAIELRTLRTAVEAYFAQNGTWPATEAELVGDYLADEIELADLGADGDVVPAPDTDCAAE